MNQFVERIKQNISWPKAIMWIGILVVLSAPAIKGWRVYQAATSLQTRIESLQGHAENGLSGLNAEYIEGEIIGMRADAVNLNQEITPLLPYLNWLTWVPRAGELIPVLPELLRLLDSGTAIAADLGVEMLPVLPILQDDSVELIDKSPQILAVIDQADPSLETTALLWPSMYADLNTVLNNPAARDALPWQLRQQLPTLEPLLPLVSQGIETVRILPEVAALDGRRSYLIVGQNSDELRATGGFLSMTMAVGVENGRLRGNYISDANVIDNFLEKPYGDPPIAMREFIGIDLFLFRDSNYWPDFPTSGRKMMDFYTYGTGVELDGIFAIDIRFISRLIGAIGPIQVPESDIVLTNDNTLDILEQAWSQGLDIGGVSRKDFLGNIAAGLINHLQSDSFEPNIGELAFILDESVRDKSLQVFIDSPEEKEAFAKMGVNGRITYGQGEDILLLLANNVGVNKSNRWVESELGYSVELHDDNTATAEVVSTWRHLGPPPAEETSFCSTDDFSYKPGSQYATMTLACNWNHIRLYAPQNASLTRSGSYPVGAAEMRSETAWDGETRQLDNDLPGFSVFENLMLIPIGETKSFSAEYDLPQVVTPISNGEHIYRLNLIRQSGVYPYPPTTINITLPQGSRLVTSSIEPVNISGDTISFSTVLRENQLLEIVFDSGTNTN